MKLFIFGAGATRGASFVKLKKNSCLPPLDNDFFTQLQRIKNRKHQQTIKSVIQNTVNLFGTNFQLTLENIFSTLENIIRMVKMSGEKRDFKLDELIEMRTTLLQALAAVLEESLTSHINKSHRSSLEMSECQYHKKIITKILQSPDTLISFNYDCLLDCMLKKYGDEKWNPYYGYGFSLRGEGAKIKGHENWAPTKAANKKKTIKLFKLHGSLHFKFKKNIITLKQRPYTKQKGSLEFDIIPPEPNKEFYKDPYSKLWKLAGSAIYKADTIIVIGYSFPSTDLSSASLFQINLKKDSLKKVVIINPDQKARQRTREILKRGITNQTLILVFDTLKDFIDSGINV